MGCMERISTPEVDPSRNDVVENSSAGWGPRFFAGEEERRFFSLPVGGPSESTDVRYDAKVAKKGIFCNL